MKFKRFLSLLLALTLVLSYVPVGAFATETGDNVSTASTETTYVADISYKGEGYSDETVSVNLTYDGTSYVGYAENVPLLATFGAISVKVHESDSQGTLGSGSATPAEDGNYNITLQWSDWDVAVTLEKVEDSANPEIPTVKTVATEAELAAALAEGGDIKLETQKMGDMYMPLNVTSILTVPADKTVNLDLNGITVVLNDKYLVNEGTLTVKNGTLSAGIFNDTTNGAAIYNKGTLVVDGANVSGVCAAIRTESGKVTINSGTISATENSGKTAALLRVKGGEVVINGGTFVGCNSTNGNEGCLLFNVSGGSVVVNGGHFSDFAGQTMPSYAQYVTISAGTFVPGTTDGWSLAHCLEGSLAPGYAVGEDGIVYEIPPQGNDFTGYMNETAIWGEVWGNALTSFVIKVLDANGNVMGTTSLNNIDGIIDGDVNVTWTLKLDAASNTDEYWTMNWTNAPSLTNVPAAVELWVDGIKVSGGNVVMNGPDNLHPVFAAKVDDSGKILGYIACDGFDLSNASAKLQSAINAGDHVAILTAGTYAVPTGKNCTITGAVDGVVFDNIGACGMGGASVTFNNVTFNYAANSTYKGLQHSGNMVYNNCTFNGQVFLYGQSETFNNCTFNNTGDNYNVWTYGAKAVEFNGCTFNCDGKAVLVYNEGACATELEVVDTDFIASAPVDGDATGKGKAAIEIDTSLMPSGTVIDVDAATTATNFSTNTLSESSLWHDKKVDTTNKNGGGTTSTVIVNNETVKYPVMNFMVGEAYYSTLETAAAAAAQSGEAIKLLADITVTEEVSLNGITLTTGEFTLTNNGTINFTDCKLENAVITGTGSAKFYGNINFYGENQVLSTVDGGPFELIVNKGATLLISRFVLGYNRNITVYGEIEDAHSFDPEGKTPSLQFNSTSGVSVGGYGTGNLTVVDAYVELGNSSWKNAQGTYEWNFKNSYVSATSFTDNKTGYTEDAAWNVTFDDSVLAAKNYIKNGVGATYNFTNGSVATTGSMKIDGVLNIDATSSVTANAQQNNKHGAASEHEDINGTVNVEGTLNIGGNSYLEVLTGELNVNGGTVNITSAKPLHIAADGNVNVNGGTITGDVDVSGNLTSNGNISGKITKTADNAKISISGGIYTQDVSAWCANGYIAVDNGDGTFKVKSEREAWILRDGVIKYYGTLAEAVADAKNGETIILQANVEIAEVITIDKNITIGDYGNLTITPAGEGAFYLKGAAQLTLNNLIVKETPVFTDNSETGAAINGQVVTGVVTQKSSVSYDGTTVTVVNPAWVAKNGTTYYMTVNEALTAAQPGDEVVIFAGTYAQGLSVTKDITVIGEGEVNFNGKLSITGNGATVKGLNFNNGGYINAKDVLVEDCTVVGSNGFRNCYTSGTVTFKDSTITGSVYGIHFDGSKGGEIVIDNCVITGWTSFAASIKKVTMTDTTFAEGNYNYVRFYQDADIDNCTFNEKMSVDVSNDVSATVKVTDSTVVNGNVEELFSAADINKSDIYVDGERLITPAAEINGVAYDTFEAALNAVQDGETIVLLNVSENESGKEIDFSKDIEFTITGNAPEFALPVITFQNATVNIKDAEILIPELDARQNATINVINSTVHDAGGNSIAKSYYNGAINISGNSVVYMMQVTTMGYITVSDTAVLNATWQTNVYGNGMITIEDSAVFNTAALHLVGKDYSGRDNTDADRVGKPAAIIVDGATVNVGKVYSDNGADYSYNSSKGVNIGTIEGKSAVLDIKNGAAFNIYLANGETANIGADGTVNVNGTVTVSCRKDGGSATLVNNGSIVLNSIDSVVTANECGNVTGTVADYKPAYVDGAYKLVAKVYVAQLGDEKFESLAEAIANVKNGETIELLAAIDEDVTVVQAPDVKITIDGKGNTFSGTITVDGKSAAYATAGLTIKNVKFDATDISKDASINLGGSNATRYTSNVSVIDCSFAGEGQTKVGIKSYTGGCKNLSVTGCSATGMHSLMQLYKTTGLVIDNCTVTDSKNGISVRSSEGTITNCTIDVDGYGVRADGDSVSTLTVSGNTIDAAKPVIVRKTTADGYKLAVDGNTLTAPDGEYQVIITKGDDEEAPVDPACKFVFEGNTDDLSVYPCDLYVAEINGKGYMTINEALTAAQPGDEVVIFAGTYAQGLSVTKDITVIGEGEVNFNGKLSITGNGATVKGLNFNNGGASAGYINAKDVLVEDCTVVGGNGFRNCYTTGTVTFKDSTITGATYGIHFDGSAGGEIVIDNCVITGWTSFAASIKKVTMTDTTFAEGNYNYVRFYQDADIDNCTFNEKMSVDVSNDVSATVQVTNSTVVNGSVEELFSAADIDKSDIYVDGKRLITPAAEINGVEYDTLAEALAAVQAGDNTITLVADLDEDVIIEQVEGINITIDGDNHVYTGTMEIYGHARYNGEETLTIKNVKFETSEAKHDFITCNTTESVKRYAHNVTVEDCSFTATGDAVNSAVGLRLRQCYDILVKNSTATGLHSLIQATGGNTMVIDTVTVDGCKNGIAAGTTDGVTVKNSTINVTGYGVRADGNAASDMTVSGNTITAAQPVVVRRTTAAYDLTVTGNTLNAPEGAYQVVITEGEDDAAYVNPTGAFALESDVDTNKVYPAAAYAAQVGDHSYTSVEAALEAAENDDTVIILKDLTVENTIVVTKSVTIDLNGQTLTGSCNPVIRVKEANVTVQGGNIVNNEGYCFIVGSTDASGELTIKDGNFRASTTVASVTKGYLTIEGGYFAVDAYSGEGYENYNFLLNCIDANYKTGEAGITVKGGSFENFNPADNAAEGLGTNFVDPLYEATTTNGVVWNVNAYGAGEIPENPIYVEWIWNDEQTEATATVSVPANATYYFAAYISGMEMTINGELYGMLNGSRWMPASFTITNDGDAVATYELKITYPVGTMNNTAELVIGDNTASIEAGNNQGYFFGWTAEEDGTLIITMPEGDWMYVINNMTSYVYGDMQWSDSDPVVNPVAVEVAAGDEIQVMVNSYDPANMWSNPAADITFTAEFNNANNLFFVEWNWNEAQTEATANITVPAGATLYYGAYVSGMELTINGESAGMLNGSRWMPASFTVANDGETAATYELKISYPVGTQGNPAELVIGDNTASIEAGNDQGYFFTWTAPAAGMLTITMPEGDWMYVINNMTSYIYGDMQWSDSDPVVNPAVLHVAEGDELQIMVNSYDPASWNNPAAELVINAAFAGDEQNPIMVDWVWNDEQTEATATVEVGANATYYYSAYVSGMELTINGESAGMLNGSRWMPATFTVTNDGDAVATFDLKITYPVGNMSNPAELVIGDNTATIEAGNNQGYWFTWTAAEDGVLVITMPEGDWTYVINNLTTYQYGDTQWSDSDPVVNPAYVNVAAGDEIQIMVSTYDPNAWEAPAGTVVFDADFWVPVAQNKDTGKVYGTVADAMAEAKSGETVILTADVTEDMLYVRVGRSLDLNGYVLTVNDVVAVNNANIVDNSTANTGMLVVNSDNVMISRENAQLPVWNGTGYIFTTVDLTRARIANVTEDSFVFAFQPRMLDAAKALLADGANDNDVTIEARVSWETKMGREYRNLVFNETQISTVIPSANGAFLLTFSGFQSLDIEGEILVEAVVYSGTGVVYASTGLTVNVG